MHANPKPLLSFQFCYLLCVFLLLKPTVVFFLGFWVGVSVCKGCLPIDYRASEKTSRAPCVGCHGYIYIAYLQYWLQDEANRSFPKHVKILRIFYWDAKVAKYGENKIVVKLALYLTSDPLIINMGTSSWLCCPMPKLQWNRHSMSTWPWDCGISLTRVEFFHTLFQNF